MNKNNVLGKLALITAPNLNYDRVGINIHVYTDEKFDLIKSNRSFERINPLFMNCTNCDVCILLGKEEILSIDKYWKIFYKNNMYWISKEWIEIVR